MIRCTYISAIIAAVIISGPGLDAMAANPDAIFKKTMAAYKALDTYSTRGTVVSDIKTGGMKMIITSEFTVQLKKPNMYLVTWSQKNVPVPGMTQRGAAWSDGTQPYLYMGAVNAYSKMASDQIALGGATGISGGVANTVPSMFLDSFKEQVPAFSRLIEPKVEKVEKVDGEACYVISGASAISKKETYWISKKSFLMLKYYRSLEPPKGGMSLPKISDEQLEEAIRALGQEANEENKERMRIRILRAQQAVVRAKLKGGVTEHHKKISHRELRAADFRYTVPEGTTLKASLFDAATRDRE